MTAWRVIITDSESASGVAPVCPHQDNGDRCPGGGYQPNDEPYDPTPWWEIASMPEQYDDPRRYPLAHLLNL